MILTILLIISGISSTILLTGYIWDNENIQITGWILIGLTIFFGWFLTGVAANDHTKYIIHNAKNLEIIRGENKVFITNRITNKTYIFEDAKTYNLIKDTTKQYYVEITKYCMYGGVNSNDIIVTDTIIPDYKQK